MQRKGKVRAPLRGRRSVIISGTLLLQFVRVHGDILSRKNHDTTWGWLCETNIAVVVPPRPRRVILGACAQPHQTLISDPAYTREVFTRDGRLIGTSRNCWKRSNKFALLRRRPRALWGERSSVVNDNIRRERARSTMRRVRALAGRENGIVDDAHSNPGAISPLRGIYRVVRGHRNRVVTFCTIMSLVL